MALLRGSVGSIKAVTTVYLEGVAAEHEAGLGQAMGVFDIENSRVSDAALRLRLFLCFVSALGFHV